MKKAPAWLMPSFQAVAALPVQRAKSVADEMTAAERRKEARRRSYRKWWFGPKGQAWREATRDRSKKQRSAWREANREAIRAKHKAWREANLEHCRFRQLAYYYANHDERRAYLNAKQREYRRRKQPNT